MEYLHCQLEIRPYTGRETYRIAVISILVFGGLRRPVKLQGIRNTNGVKPVLRLVFQIIRTQ